MHKKTFRKLSGVLFAFVMFLSVFGQLVLNVPSAFAHISPCGSSCNATWSSYYDITLASTTFHDDPTNDQYIDPSNNTYTMFYVTPPDSACPTALMFNTNPTTANAAIEAPGVVTGGGTGRNLHGCDWSYSSGTPISLNQRPSVSTTATWISQSPPQVSYNNNTFDGTNGINGNAVTLTEIGGSGSSCPVTILVNNYQNSTAGTTATLTTQVYLPPGGCYQSKNSTIYLSNAYSSASPTPPGTTPQSNPALQCPVTGGAAFFLCPIFALGQLTLGALSVQINNFLYIPTTNIFSGNNSGFQTTFDNFRDIGLALLVIAGLVMVISQAAGLEVFAAYTVRKTLPRLVIAIIGIALAWSLLQFVVTFFDDIGSWTNAIILQVANVKNAGSAYNPSEIISPTGVVALGAAGAGVVLLGALGAFSLLLTALLALFVGFLILALRWLVVVVCILFAPLAIAAYVLPGTSKIWDFWRDALLGALIMYPLIIGFLAAGSALSYIAAQYNPILALIVFFAPYFLLPIAFRLTSGIMGTLATGVQGAHGGVFARLKKQRQEIRASNWQAVKYGTRYHGTTGLAGKFNTASGFGGAFLSSKDKIGFMRDKDTRNVAQQRHGAMAMADLLKRGDTQATQFNDDMLRLQTWKNADGGEGGGEEGFKSYLRDVKGVTNENEINDRFNRAKAAVMDNGGFNAIQQQYAFTQLAAIGTGFENQEDAAKTVARVSNGNRAIIASLVGNTRPLHERAGRPELKAEFGTMQSLAEAEAGLDGKSKPTADMYTAATVEAALMTDNTSLVRAKKKTLENISQALGRTAQAPMDIAQARKALGDKESVDVLASQLQGQVKAKFENIQGAGAWGPEVNLAVTARAQRDKKFAPALQNIQQMITPPSTPDVRPVQRIIYGPDDRPLRQVIETPPTTGPAPNPIAQQAHDDISMRGRGAYDPNAEPRGPEPPPEEP